jgi:hypothetical protein
MRSAPCSHLGVKARKRERVRCSSLVDWPVYLRLRRTKEALTQLASWIVRANQRISDLQRRVDELEAKKTPPVRAGC